MFQTKSRNSDFKHFFFKDKNKSQYVKGQFQKVLSLCNELQNEIAKC